jgi:iron complex outermembrane recepter protein
MGVVPPARIPANKAAAHPCSHDAHAVGEDGAGYFSGLFLFMKSRIHVVRLAALPVALGAVFSVNAQSGAPVMKEVVVTASRFSENASELPYGVSVITASEIAASGASSVGEAVMKLLGVAGRLDLTGGGNYGLDLRGFGVTADQNQVVVVDGRRLTEQDQGGTGLAGIPIETVDRIEVIRGNAAVVYGEGATGGAIVVTTKSGMGMQGRNAAQISASAGSFGLQELRTSATVGAAGLTVDVAASDRHEDGHRENFASTRNSLSSTVQWSSDWFRVGVQASRNLMHSGTPGGLTLAEYQANPYQANANYRTDYNQIKSETSGAFAEAIVGPWQIGMDLGTRSKKYDGEFSWGSYLYDIDASSANLRARHELTAAGLKNAFVVGLDSDAWTRKTQGISTAKAESNAVYLADDLFFSATGTRLAAGLRQENLNKNTANPAVQVSDTPSAWHLGLTQSLSQVASTYVRTGKSYRLPNVDEFSFVAPGSMLSTQTSRDMEWGLRMAYESGRAELRWYRSDLDNEIAYDPTAYGPGSLYSPPYNFDGANVNLDPTRHEGLEFELRQSLSTSLNLRANAAVRRSYFVSGPYAGRDLALVPKQTLALGAGWIPKAGHALDFGINWVSSQQVDFQNQCSVPAYSTMDLRYALTLRSVELSLGVKNLTDARFYTYAANCAGNLPNGIYIEPGRSATATVKVTF